MLFIIYSFDFSLYNKDCNKKEIHEFFILSESPPFALYDIKVLFISLLPICFLMKYDKVLFVVFWLKFDNFVLINKLLL